VRCKKKKVPTVAFLVSRSANVAVVVLMAVAESASGGILESGGRFYVTALGRNLASVAMKIFSFLIYFIQKFYTFLFPSRLANAVQ
jgi:hypothetical protein